jgi:hypothetical protein
MASCNNNEINDRQGNHTDSNSLQDLIATTVPIPASAVTAWEVAAMQPAINREDLCHIIKSALDVIGDDIFTDSNDSWGQYSLDYSSVLIASQMKDHWDFHANFKKQ